MDARSVEFETPSTPGKSKKAPLGNSIRRMVGFSQVTALGKPKDPVLGSSLGKSTRHIVGFSRVTALAVCTSANPRILF